MLFQTLLMCVRERKPEMKKQILLIVLLMLSLTACGGQTQTPGAGHYAGQVENSNAFIGLVTDGQQLQAFFCDGTVETTPLIWGWFRGDLNGSTFELANENGDRLNGEFAANGASGAITLADGTVLNFQAELVREPAGLYRFEETIDGVGTTIAWIILPSQELRGGTNSGGQLSPPPNPPVGDLLSWADPQP
jgi:hypothetical protein